MNAKWVVGLLLASLAAADVGAEITDARSRNFELDRVGAAIRKHRARWRHGDNPLSRLSRAERLRRLGARVRSRAGLRPQAPLAEAPRAEIPAAFDWRSVGGESYVTPVKDQGACGSCWAFSTTGALESYVLRTRGAGEPASLSEQAVLACSGAGSCRGGSPDDAADYLLKTGIPSADVFPYAQSDAACPLDPGAGPVRRVGRWLRVPADVESLKAALVRYGPLPTTLFVYDDFFTYKDGVYSHVDGSTAGYHAVLLIGYDDAQQAFSVKNSWGRGWGEGGYFRIAYAEVAGDTRIGLDTIAFSTAEVTPVSVAVTGSKSGPESVSVAAETTLAGDTRLERLSSAVDGGEPQRLEPAASWSAGLDTSTLPEGRHAITVTALDDAGNSGEARFEFEVRRTVEVSWVEPADGGRVCSARYQPGAITEVSEGCAPPREASPLWTRVDERWVMFFNGSEPPVSADGPDASAVLAGMQRYADANPDLAR